MQQSRSQIAVTDARDESVLAKHSGAELKDKGRLIFLL